MFTATRVAAGVAILALSGSLALVAGPLTPERATMPLASAESPSSVQAMGGHTTGTMRLGVGTYGETTAGDAWTERRGSDWSTIWTSDDSRLSGHGSFAVDTNTYLATDGTEFAAGWAELTLENEDGSWSSLAPAAGVGMGDFGQSSFWFDGAGGYEGLSAFLVQDLAWNPVGAPYYEFEAWIVPGDAHLTQMFE